mgnify:CR=1 FL=1
MSRYTVAGSEGQYEKNSGERVLANKLGIADANEMDSVELVLLEQLYRSVFEEHFPTGLLSVNILKKWQLLKDCWREKKRLDIWVLSSESISLMEV